MTRFIFFSFIILIISACGANFFKPFEGKNPADEQERLDKQSNKDPDKTLADAKEKLSDGVQKALTNLEKIISGGKAYKDLTEDDLKELKTAIPKEVKEAFVGDDIDNAGKKEILQDYSDVMLAYSQTTDYNEINFLNILLESSDNLDSGDNSFALAEEECPDGLEVFIDVAGNTRPDFCDADGIADLENLEISALLGELVYTEEQPDTSFDYSAVMEALKNGSTEDISDLIERDNFSTYLLSLFFQVTYAACEFVEDDCGIDTSGVSLGGLKRIWENLQLSYTLEQSLEKSGLLPDLSFSAKGMVDTVLEDSNDIESCSEYGTEPIYCTLLDYFRNAGVNCKSIEKRPGDCKAKS